MKRLMRSPLVKMIEKEKSIRLHIFPECVENNVNIRAVISPPGGHPPALLHPGNRAVGGRDRSQHLQASDT